MTEQFFVGKKVPRDLREQRRKEVAHTMGKSHRLQRNRKCTHWEYKHVERYYI